MKKLWMFWRGYPWILCSSIPASILSCLNLPKTRIRNFLSWLVVCLHARVYSIYHHLNVYSKSSFLNCLKHLLFHLRTISAFYQKGSKPENANQWIIATKQGYFTTKAVCGHIDVFVPFIHLYYEWNVTSKFIMGLTREGSGEYRWNMRTLLKIYCLWTHLPCDIVNSIYGMWKIKEARIL